MVMIRHLLESIFNPFSMLLILLVISIWVLFRRGNTGWVRGGLVVVISGLLIGSTAFFPKWLTHHLENDYPIIDRINPAVHFIVVFGGGQAHGITGSPHNILSTVSVKWLLEGIRLYRQLPEATLVLSGGGYKKKISEAENMATLTSWFKIPQKDVILETESVNTADEAVAIKKWLHQKPFYLVTSAIHMPRAMQLCQQQGLHPIAAPTDFTYYWDDGDWEKTHLPNPKNLLYLNIAWHEIIGKIWAQAFT